MSNDPNESDAGATSATLHDISALVGGRVWLERRLFSMLGGWVTSTPEPRAKLFLDEMSRRHGWHAQVWFERLPQLSVIDAEALVVPPDPSAVALFEQLELAGSTVTRLDGTYRVLLPRLVTAYRRTLEGLAPAADASLARWSRVILTDDVEEWQRGEELLDALVVDDDQLAEMATRRLPLERLLLDGRALPS